MSEKKNNILIKLLAPLVAIGLFGSLCIAGLFGGSGNALPAEEDTATEYQMIGGQMNVNWQWIMLIDMFLAQMEDHLFQYGCANDLQACSICYFTRSCQSLGKCIC